MKKLITAIVLTLATAAHALNPSIVLTVGQWLIKQSDRVYYVQVEGRGYTDAEARRNGFALAVEQAIGTLVLSERETAQHQLTRKDVTAYSSGYVDNYKILSKTYRGNEVSVTMDVWVAHSAIATRLLGRSETAGQVDGARIGAQVQTVLKERADGDTVISRVLHDFPQRAFDISLTHTKVRIDANRRTLLEIPFSMKWNYNYVVSLHEALQATAQNPEARNCWNHNNECSNQAYVKVAAKDPGRFAQWQNTLGFNDYQKHHLIRDAFGSPVMQLVVRDTSNRTVFRNCYLWTDLAWSDSRSFADWTANQISVNGALSKSSSIVLDLGQNAPRLESFNNIELSVVRAESCKA